MSLPPAFRDPTARRAPRSRTWEGDRQSVELLWSLEEILSLAQSSWLVSRPRLPKRPSIKTPKRTKTAPIKAIHINL